MAVMIFWLGRVMDIELIPQRVLVLMLYIQVLIVQFCL